MTNIYQIADFVGALIASCISNACPPGPLSRWTVTAREEKAGDRAPEIGDRTGPIHARSVAAPRECRARPAGSRGHSSRDRSRDTPADTGAARPVLRRGSV